MEQQQEIKKDFGYRKLYPNLTCFVRLCSFLNSIHLQGIPTA